MEIEKASRARYEKLPRSGNPISPEAWAHSSVGICSARSVNLENPRVMETSATHNPHIKKKQGLPKLSSNHLEAESLNIKYRVHTYFLINPLYDGCLSSRQNRTQGLALKPQGERVVLKNQTKIVREFNNNGSTKTKSILMSVAINSRTGCPTLQLRPCGCG